MNTKLSSDKKTLIIELPVQSPPVASASGKTLIVATTSGNVRSGLTVNGQDLIIGVNAYIYATAKPKKDKEEAE